MTTQELKNELRLEGWTFLGVCNCQPPLHDWIKDKNRIKYNAGKDLYNLFDRNRKVISIGSSDTLLNNIKQLSI
jgi:hypothetical protein